MKQVLCLTLVLVFLTAIPVAAENVPGELLQDALYALREITGQPDSPQLRGMLRGAHGVAIFPKVIKAGLGLGGRYGEGVILKYDQTSRTWSGPYFASIKGLSYGIQVGIQSTALLLVVAHEDGMRGLQENKITLGGSLSIAAGPMGRSAEAGADVELRSLLYSYSLSKGAFVGASFEGAVISNNKKANEAFWDDQLTPAEILTRQSPDEGVRALIAALNSVMAGKN